MEEEKITRFFLRIEKSLKEIADFINNSSPKTVIKSRDKIGDWLREIAGFMRYLCEGEEPPVEIFYEIDAPAEEVTFKIEADEDAVWLN